MKINREVWRVSIRIDSASMNIVEREEVGTG